MGLGHRHARREAFDSARAVARDALRSSAPRPAAAQADSRAARPGTRRPSEAPGCCTSSTSSSTVAQETSDRALPRRCRHRSAPPRTRHAATPKATQDRQRESGRGMTVAQPSAALDVAQAGRRRRPSRARSSRACERTERADRVPREPRGRRARLGARARARARVPGQAGDAGVRRSRAADVRLHAPHRPLPAGSRTRTATTT